MIEPFVVPSDQLTEHLRQSNASTARARQWQDQICPRLLLVLVASNRTLCHCIVSLAAATTTTTYAAENLASPIQFCCHGPSISDEATRVRSLTATWSSLLNRVAAAHAHSRTRRTSCAGRRDASETSRMMAGWLAVCSRIQLRPSLCDLRAQSLLELF